ncbi:MAG: hypothetical protein RDV41_06000 [Planctomycetota bacterium]|nr:hypothetical protein [Planctomycetota bacterium]
METDSDWPYLWRQVRAELVVTEWYENERELLTKCRTAMKAFDHIHYCEELSAHHLFDQCGNKGFTEVFFGLPGNDFISLVEAQ